MNPDLGLLLVAALVAALLSGLPIGLALLALAIAGDWMLRGSLDFAVRLIGMGASSNIAEYVFFLVPCFVLMGTLLTVSGVAGDTFAVADRLLRRVKGGVGVATVAANAVFASITGISVASAMIFAQVAVPEMIKFGYRPRFAACTVASSSILGMLIPPSLLMIVYGFLAEVSVGKLFVASLIPGLLMALAFTLYVMFAARFRDRSVFAASPPSATRAFAPAAPGTAPPPSPFVVLLPIAGLVTLVLGGIYSGVFTATEAGAVGAVGALAITWARRRLNRSTAWWVLQETALVTASIMFLLFSASLFSQTLALAGVPAAVEQVILDAGLGRYAFLLLYIVIAIALGAILDSVSILLILVPICAPVAQAFGIDLVHFGIVSVIAVEVGLLTPPFGMSVFAVHSVLRKDGMTLEDIFVGVMPFVAVMLLVLAVVTFVPTLSLLLV